MAVTGSHQYLDPCSLEVDTSRLMVSKDQILREVERQHHFGCTEPVHVERGTNKVVKYGWRVYAAQLLKKRLSQSDDFDEKRQSCAVPVIFVDPA